MARGGDCMRSRLSVAVAGDRAELGAVVARGDPADGARARAHDERLRRRAAGALVADTLEHVAVGDAGRREEAVVGGDEVVGGELTLEVVALLERRAALLVVARPQPPDDLAAHRL